MAATVKRRSIGKKLAWLVLISVTSALLVATSVAVIQETRRYIDTKSQSFLDTARIFASATGVAAAKRDDQAALAAMRAIGNLSSIVQARIELADGSTLASLGLVASLDQDAKLTPERLPDVWSVLTSGTIETNVPIFDNGNIVGQFIMVARADDLLDRLIATLSITIAGAGAAVLVGLMVARRLSRTLTGPLGDVTTAMARIRDSHAYDTDVRVDADDEVAEMVDGFNAMLGEIRKRDVALEAHLAKLEDEVAARTEDYREAKDAAETANRAKSDFLAAMSHEIRTPMNGIMVMAELLAAGDLPERPRRHAEVIARSGKSLVTIINDILDLSKIEAGKLELESIAYDPAEIADQTVSLFAERARSKGLDLVAYVDPAVPATLMGDPVRVHQVITNLVNNALKFTEKGAVTLSIGLDPVDPRSLLIKVTDTGIGIAADKLDSVFGAFSQADQTTTRKYGGTGLGLAICRKLVEAMGSTILVTSELGHGSTFMFSIPLDGSTPAAAWPKVQRQRVVILAVDGDETTRVLELYLAAAGYRVGKAPKGFDCSTLPDGAVAIGSPRRLGGTAKAGTVIAAAPFGDRDAEAMIANGRAHAILSTPLQRAEVVEILAKLARGESLTAARTAQAPDGMTKSFGHLKILVADDNAVNIEVAVAALARFGATADVVVNGREAVEASAKTRYDIVLMDGSMPEMDGFEATRHIRAREAAEGTPHLPIVALTAHVIGAGAKAWEEAGMDAVLHKPFTLDALCAVIEKFHGPARLVPKQALAVQTPPVAPAPAPKPAALEKPAAPAPAANGEIPCLLDEKLEELAEMAAAGRPDFATRVFGLWRDSLPRIEDALRISVEAGDLEEVGRAAHALKSMSLNIGAARVADIAAALETGARIDAVAPSKDMLLRLADALAATKGAIQTYLRETVESEIAAPAVGATKSALARAIEAGHIRPHYQPIVDRTGSTLMGVEALARWIGPEGTGRSPADFVGEAEHDGLVMQLGGRIMETALAEAKVWPGINLSVNVSPFELRSPGFEAQLDRLLQESSFPANQLTLEITETAVLGHEAEMVEKLKRIRARRIGLALDDFGTGYSSLAYLRRFPFDRIKIDRSFVSGVEEAMDAAAIVHAVTAIGRALGLKVVAEGVETEPQHKFLMTAGVHYMQGYRFGRATPAIDITERVLRERARGVA
ncbi:MAG: EAL domain-containing protein [Alphaproteobacteria bacterium]